MALVGRSFVRDCKIIFANLRLKLYWAVIQADSSK